MVGDILPSKHIFGHSDVKRFNRAKSQIHGSDSQHWLGNLFLPSFKGHIIDISYHFNCKATLSLLLGFDTKYNLPFNVFNLELALVKTSIFEKNTSKAY